jgi:hypothetical protein
VRADQRDSSTIEKNLTEILPILSPEEAVAPNMVEIAFESPPCQKRHVDEALQVALTA